jgi:hypothetical protein
MLKDKWQEIAAWFACGLVVWAASAKYSVMEHTVQLVASMDAREQIIDKELTERVNKLEFELRCLKK